MRNAIPRIKKDTLIFSATQLEILPAKYALSQLLRNPSPLDAIQTGKLMAKAWAKSLEGIPEHLNFARSFIYKIMDRYWEESEYKSIKFDLPTLSSEVAVQKLDDSLCYLAEALGVAASKLDIIEASYQLGNIYTAVLPQDYRSGNGIFYTPPALTNRLLNMVTDTGIDWATARILDPACGGGAFLAPIALRIVCALKGREPEYIIEHINTHIAGYDLDPFGAWLTQVFLEVGLKDLMIASGKRVNHLINIGSSLELDEKHIKFDAVIGNPPYGKIKLSHRLRLKFRRSLYGHANLYGLFTDLALQLVKPGGTIGYLTPTSFLSGEYFKNLRCILRKESSPFEMDFVSFRKGVFEDVLQETMLATYIKNTEQKCKVKVNQITTSTLNTLEIHSIGKFNLPVDTFEPWILPRTPQQAPLVKHMLELKYSFKDWGFKISTGPFVWNRYKDQLHKKKGSGFYPVIWAESITQDGRFIYKTEKKNHLPFLKFLPGDDWLLTRRPCILLQRTTAKEQHKRLIAAALTEEFIKDKDGVIIENHLNMIMSIEGCDSRVSTSALSFFLNSKAVNEAFRCVSGSVAVSAYELEYLPLPAPEALIALQNLVGTNASKEAIEMECQRLYTQEKNE
jgi:adenine-specific DNA-methyltransferase